MLSTKSSSSRRPIVPPLDLEGNAMKGQGGIIKRPHKRKFTICPRKHRFLSKRAPPPPSSSPKGPQDYEGDILMQLAHDFSYPADGHYLRTPTVRDPPSFPSLPALILQMALHTPTAVRGDIEAPLPRATIKPRPRPRVHSPRGGGDASAGRAGKNQSS